MLMWRVIMLWWLWRIVLRGVFADDFSYDKGYRRKMPGKAARKALRALERKYDDLKVL